MSTSRRSAGARLATVLMSVAWLAVGCAAPAGPTVVHASASPPPTTRPTIAPPTASAFSPSPTPTVTPGLESFGPLPMAPLAKEKVIALQAVLDAAVAAGAPNAIAAVISVDGTWAGAAGISGANGQVATPTDEFAIASITKTFTAALVLRLVERGKIDLDAPLASYMGDLTVDTNGATVRQALQMRAGLGDDGPEVADQIVADPGRAWTSEESVAGLSAPFAPAGTAYRYSSPTYRLLAIAAEHATGMSFAAALRAEILDPVGADRILDQVHDSATPRPWALPIGDDVGRFDPSDLGAGGAISCLSSATRTMGSASMASDAPSLAAWLWRLSAGDILGAESLALMVPSPGDPWEFGLEAAPFGGQSFGSAGNKTGYGSQFAVFPESRSVVVMLVNDPGFEMEPTISQLLRVASA